MNKLSLPSIGLILMGMFLGVLPVRAQVDPNIVSRLGQAPIVINSQSVALFDRIPEEYIERAKNIRMIFGNRSVGVNINEAITCLEAESDEICWATRPVCSGSCVNLNHSDSRYVLPAETVNWYRVGGYSRSNWVHELFNGTWTAMTSDYMTLLDAGQVQGQRSLEAFDVFSFQFSYLNVMDTDSIASPTNGFFANRTGDKNDVFDLEQRLTGLDNKYFIYFSSSLARGIGNRVSMDFNNQMRQFVNQRDTRGRYRILFDFADIESHLPDGTACYDNRDGVEYCQAATLCENYPNDGVNYPAICQHYTVELDNGHLTTGPIKIRVAKAMWVLMAQLAGWNPGGITVTPTPSVTATPTPSLSVRQGDANGDGRVDGIDYVVWLANYNRVTTQLAAEGDFNSDGRTDGLDYVIWLSNYGI